MREGRGPRREDRAGSIDLDFLSSPREVARLAGNDKWDSRQAASNSSASTLTSSAAGMGRDRGAPNQPSL